MKDNNLVRDKSFAFALRVVKCYQYLSVEQTPRRILRQALRTPTTTPEGLVAS